MKTEKEIEEMAQKYALNFAPAMTEMYLNAKIIFIDIYTQAQKDLLESASESFDSFVESMEVESMTEADAALKIWQASRLGMMKDPMSKNINDHLNLKNLALQNEIKQLKEDLDLATINLIKYAEKDKVFTHNLIYAEEIRTRHKLDEVKE